MTVEVSYPRRSGVSALLVASLALAACAGGGPNGVSPGDGPYPGAPVSVATLPPQPPGGTLPGPTGSLAFEFTDLAGGWFTSEIHQVSARLHVRNMGRVPLGGQADVSFTAIVRKRPPFCLIFCGGFDDERREYPVATTQVTIPVVRAGETQTIPVEVKSRNVPSVDGWHFTIAYNARASLR